MYWAGAGAGTGAAGAGESGDPTSLGSGVSSSRLVDCSGSLGQTMLGGTFL